MNKQSLYPLEVRDPGDLSRAIERIGADPRCQVYFQPKRRVRHLYITHVDFRAAAYLKQELLARGGDAVVGKHVIDAQASHSDVLLLGTDGQLNALLLKLKAMDCWGLKELREQLAAVLKNLFQTRWTLPLPHGRALELDRDTKIMGILNLTRDSFHAASRIGSVDALLPRAEALLAEGADVLDLGVESTRPGATPLSEAEERAALLPALEALRKAFPQAVLSVDTYKGAVALAAAEAGADIINDVGGLSPDMASCVARSELPYVLSHIKGSLSDIQTPPAYADLLGELHLYFQEKIRQLEELGVARSRILLDPGLGFGKQAADNLLVVKEIESFQALGLPVLVGHSRKQFIGAFTGASAPEERLAGTLAVSASLEGRVQMVRVHDVRENRQALAMARAVRKAQR